MKTKMKSIFICLMILSLFYSELCYPENIDTATLDAIVFSLNQELSDSSDHYPSLEFCGIVAQVQGKVINKNVRSFLLEKKSFYNNPADCCAAALLARLEEDEVWYGALAAPADKRDRNGEPVKSYVPNSTENIFNVATYYKVNPNFPRIVDYDILNYIRIGGVQAFQIEITKELDGKKSKNLIVEMVEEFRKGCFRLNPELTRFDTTPVTSIFTIATNETEEQRIYRTKFPEQHHQIPITGIYGDNNGKFPLILMFRGGIPSDNSDYKMITQKSKSIHNLRDSFDGGIELYPTEEEYLQSDKRRELSKMLDHRSMELMDKAGMAGRTHSFDKDRVFIIDGERMLLLFFTDESGLLYNFFETYYEDDGIFTLRNFCFGSSLKKFLTHKDVWPEFSSELERLIDKGYCSLPQN